MWVGLEVLEDLVGFVGGEVEEFIDRLRHDVILMLGLWKCGVEYWRVSGWMK